VSDRYITSIYSTITTTMPSHRPTARTHSSQLYSQRNSTVLWTAASLVPVTPETKWLWLFWQR